MKDWGQACKSYHVNLSFQLNIQNKVSDMGNCFFASGSKIIDIVNVLAHRTNNANNANNANQKDNNIEVGVDEIKDDSLYDKDTLQKIQRMESYCKPLIFITFKGQTSCSKVGIIFLLNTIKLLHWNSSDS